MPFRCAALFECFLAEFMSKKSSCQVGTSISRAHILSQLRREKSRASAPPDSHLVLGCGGLYGDSLGPTARPCIVYYLMCVLS